MRLDLSHSTSPLSVGANGVEVTLFDFDFCIDSHDCMAILFY